ncbi:MAG: signal recognition particle protein [Proteobacteria bacterium]|nr:signal recognition particle protein [Pseudomonadota bacterium]
MFDSLTDRLGSIFDRLRKRGALSEEDVTLALREIRIALLEADVALSVVKEFVERVRERAVGQEVLRSITPGQMVVKIVHDLLVETLGEEGASLNLSVAPPAVIMMVGLQGAGKTTLTAKLARLLKAQHNKKILMASADIYRPAAREQLETLGAQTGIATLPIKANESVSDIAKRALESARLEGYDILFMDTAGRLHIDEALMDELAQLKNFLNPSEILLVADAMTGQDAAVTARAFHERLDVTGVALTRIDGDARGGATLSMRAVTGRPIKYLGTGEKLDQIEPFHADRIASRILGMGDIVTLVEKAAQTLDREEAEAFAQKARKGSFDFNDMAKQLEQVSKMGGLGGLMGMLPGVGKIKDQMASAGMNDKMVARQLAIIRSMTKKERINVKLINGSCRRRIAQGSGTSVPEVNRLLKQFTEMSGMMKRMNKLGEKGLRRHGLAALLGRSPK